MTPTDLTSLLPYLPVLKQLRKEWTEEKYCAGVFAEFAEIGYRHSDVLHPMAVRWCIQGYAAKVLGIGNGNAMFDHPLQAALSQQASEIYPHMRQEMQEHGGCILIAHVNNHHGHAAVCAVVDALIADLEAVVAQAQA